MEVYDVLIVGAGHAGAQAAALLRKGGYGGSVAILGEEPDPPYERPSLSKEYLSGEKDFDRLLLRSAEFWDQRQIVLLLNQRVTQIDPDQKTVKAGAETFGYQTLIWAAGGRARGLTCPGGQALGVHAIRRRTDVDRLIAQLGQVDQVTIVGGGYIGLETAAVLAKMDKSVTVLESQDRVLSRVAGPALSRFFEREHRARGVNVMTKVTVERLEAEDGAVRAVALADGRRISTRLVVVGIGIAPETEPLLAAGARGANGVDVDAYCRTSLPDVYAIGDCAAHANRFAGGARIRLESIQNANDQAKCAVDHVLGIGAPYDAVPWFWSHQYDLKLQTLGISAGHDQTIVRGDPDGRSFSVLYLRQERLVAIDCVNAVKDYVQARAPIVAAAKLDLARLSDAAIPLKALVAA
jgi:3-phenylpropionate/trans-cinnamate dioxygenase ferredoxin reductase subunit